MVACGPYQDPFRLIGGNQRMLSHSLPDAYALPTGSGQPAAGRHARHSMTRHLLRALPILLLTLLLAGISVPAFAQQPTEHHGGEANLILPDLSTATFIGGIDGRTLLMIGLGIAALGLV